MKIRKQAAGARKRARRAGSYLHWATMAITLSTQVNESPPSVSPIQAIPAALNAPLLGKSKTIPYSAHRVSGTVPVAGTHELFSYMDNQLLAHEVKN